MNKKKTDVAWFVEVSKNARIDLSLFQPVPVSKAKLAQIIKGFEADGFYFDSRAAETIGYVIRFCELNKIPFTLTLNPKVGLCYKIERVVIS